MGQQLEPPPAEDIPRGFYGVGKDNLVDAIVRAIAEAGGKNGDWASKYGSECENEVFSMHPFCWCENDSCPWCGEENRPNFHHKPSGFKVWWYKYIGRGMEMNRNVSGIECARILLDCLCSLGEGDAPTWSRVKPDSAKEAVQSL